jgi:hypothetical protein
MATTTKIKVKSVRVGDPNLTVSLSAEDSGTFPSFVQITATVSNGNLAGGSTTVQNHAAPQNSPAPATVVIQCPFPDSAYATGQPFGYNITNVSFSTDGQNWRSFSGTLSNDGQPWNGNVTSNDFNAAELAVLKPKPVAAGNNASLWDRILTFFRSLFG